jgi:hypothetical protein
LKRTLITPGEAIPTGTNATGYHARCTRAWLTFIQRAVAVIILCITEFHTWIAISDAEQGTTLAPSASFATDADIAGITTDFALGVPLIETAIAVIV